MNPYQNHKWTWARSTWLTMYRSRALSNIVNIIRRCNSSWSKNVVIITLFSLWISTSLTKNVTSRLLKETEERWTKILTKTIHKRIYMAQLTSKKGAFSKAKQTFMEVSKTWAHSKLMEHSSMKKRRSLPPAKALKRKQTWSSNEDNFVPTWKA